MSRRFLSIVCPEWKRRVARRFISIVPLLEIYIYFEERWLVDLYLLCVPNGNEDCLVGKYIYCMIMEMRSVS